MIRIVRFQIVANRCWTSKLARQKTGYSGPKTENSQKSLRHLKKSFGHQKKSLQRPQCFSTWVWTRASLRSRGISLQYCVSVSQFKLVCSYAACFNCSVRSFTFSRLNNSLQVNSGYRSGPKSAPAEGTTTATIITRTTTTTTRWGSQLSSSPLWRSLEKILLWFDPLLDRKIVFSNYKFVKCFVTKDLTTSHLML